MANTGHDWGAWASVQVSAGDWAADTIVDDAELVSDAITVDIKSAILIGVIINTPDAAVVANSVTIAVLGTPDDTTYEDSPGLASAQVGNPMRFKMTPVQNDIVYMQFSIDPRDYHLFKISLRNESGQTLTTTVNYKQANVPVAS